MKRGLIILLLVSHLTQAQTPVFTCGFECGLAGAHLSSQGTSSFSTTTVRSGARTARINPTASTGSIGSFVGSPADATAWVVRVYVYFATLPGATVTILSMGFAGNPGVFYNSTDGKLYTGHTPATPSLGATGVSVTTGQWYRIDFKLNAGVSPWTLDAQVDGVACAQTTKTGTAGTVGSGISCGLSSLGSTTTCDIFYDDLLASNSTGDYPIGDGYVNHFVPTSDGTHTATGTTTVKGTIATPVGTAITSATTDAFNWVNGVPFLGGATDNTRLINAQTAASTTYVEVKFGPAPGISTPTDAPRAVEVLTADREASTATGDFAVKLNDNGTESNVVARGVVAGVTSDRYTTKQFRLAPTGGAWTAASSGAGAFNNIRARFGYSSDATPDQYWRGIMIEAEFPPPAAKPRKLYNNF